MFILISLVLAVWTIKAFRNVQFRNQFRFYNCMIIVLLLEFLRGSIEIFFGISGISFGISFVFANLPIANLVTGVLLTFFCFLNIKQPGVIMVTAGSILNTTVRMANKGYMPMDPRVYIKVNGNLENLPARFVFTTETTQLPLLGDWLYFPYAGGIFSPGDVFAFLGFLTLIIQYKKLQHKQTCS